ncbi:hypothetical protein O3P69_009765 [Scylla paramamosain]|uniref:DUF4817 domain-containing protein n=1 Tax=Scylla paramamosain TaxID=85552 RepID=A0AAW0SNF5_SCYPA
MLETASQISLGESTTLPSLGDSTGEMEQAGVQERIKIVKVYFTTKSGVQTQQQFRRDFPGRNAPTRLTIKRFLDNFRETGGIQDNIEGRNGRPRSV